MGAENAGRCGEETDDDLPAATLRTAKTGRRVWANILIELCYYGNFLDVSGAQYYDLKPADDDDDKRWEGCRGDAKNGKKMLGGCLSGSRCGDAVSGVSSIETMFESAGKGRQQGEYAFVVKEVCLCVVVVVILIEVDLEGKGWGRGTKDKTRNAPFLGLVFVD